MTIPKLIVSDIDGTLLHGAEDQLSPEFFELIGQLRQQGILFAPASGRQYHSLRQLFAPVADQLCFLCENGAAVYGPSPTEADAVPLSNTFMDPQLAKALIREILADPDLEALVSCNNLCYMLPRHGDIIERMENFTRNNYICVSSVDEIPDEIIKLAAYCRRGSIHYDNTLGDRWRKYFTVSIAGDLWLDFTTANKGTGVTALASALDIPLSLVMAFGDNYNDLPMLDLVGMPVIMDNAAPDLRNRYQMHCRRVEPILQQFCMEKAPF
jgi:hypothetical protein